MANLESHKEQPLMRPRSKKNRLPALVLLAPVLLLCAGCRKHPPQHTDIAATSPYLQCIVRDLMGDETPVLRLAGPGVGPGHFAIRPSQVSQLAGCKLLLRFGFQERLDAKLKDLAAGGLKIAPVKIVGGMCEPDSYASACRQVADALVEAGLLERTQAEERLAAVSQRMASLGSRVAGQIESAKLRDNPVLASKHQEAFCRWLGLNVVGTFSASDTTCTGEINRAIAAGEQSNVRLIVANKPEGRKLADALAERLGAKAVVFGNFPEGDGNQPFDALVRRNVAALVRTSRE